MLIIFLEFIGTSLEDFSNEEDILLEDKFLPSTSRMNGHRFVFFVGIGEIALSQTPLEEIFLSILEITSFKFCHFHKTSHSLKTFEKCICMEYTHRK